MKKTLTFLLLTAALVVSTIALANQGRYWRGRPAFTAGQAKGYFIWNDSNGWHVRWTTKGRKHVFSGTITCDGAFLHAKAVSKDRKDFIKKTAADTIRFDAVAHGGMDGVDFRLSPSTRTLTFDLTVDGHRASPQEVRIGRHKKRPASVPFTIQRESRALKHATEKR